MHGSVDRLAMVSRVMFDQRLVDLRKDNEKLSEHEAWNRFGLDSLERALARACYTYFPLACACLSCWKAKRFDAENESWLDVMNAFRSYSGEECALKRCLILHAQRSGLIVAVRKSLNPESMMDPNEWVRMVDLFDQETPDCHFQILEDTDNGCWTLEYGPKFSSVNFHRNSDLDKLKNLFKIINADDEATALFWFDDDIEICREK